MKPQSEPTKLEGKGRFHEYLAAGKLQGNKALITGGEYDHFLDYLLISSVQADILLSLP